MYSTDLNIIRYMDHNVYVEASDPVGAIIPDDAGVTGVQSCDAFAAGADGSAATVNA